MRENLRRPGFLPLYAFTLVLWLIVMSPFAVVVLGAFLQTTFLGLSTEQWARGGDGESLFSVKWFGYVWGLYRGTLLFSVKLALLSVLLCLLIGVPGGMVLARRQFPGRDLLESIVLLPLSLPGIALSIGILQAFAIVRGEWWLILAGHLLYTLPFMVRMVMDALRSFDVAALETAARSLGAGYWQRLRWVVLPNLRHAMVAASLLVFCVSWGEFNISFLLNTPLNQTFPAALYATYTTNSFQVSSAATVIFLGVVVPALMAIQWLGGGRGVKLEQGV